MATLDAKVIPSTEKGHFPSSGNQNRLRASSAMDGGNAPSRGVPRQSQRLAASQGLPISNASPSAEKRVELAMHPVCRQER